MPIKFSKPGISVWEVIIIILGIIIVMVFVGPIFMHFHHGNMHQPKCMSNMRQLSLGLMMTAQDDKDVMPAANEWMVKSRVTGDGLYDCPSNKFKASRTTPDYMYVAAFFHNQHGLLSKRKLNSIKDTTLTPELVELIDPGKPGQTAYVSDAEKMSDGQYGYDLQAALMNKIDRFRHNGSSNVAFIDGHIEYVMASNLNVSMLMNSMTSNEPLARPFIIDSFFTNMHAVCAAPPGSSLTAAIGACGTEGFDAIFTLGDFIAIGRPKTSMRGTKGAIITIDGKTGEFTFTGGGKVFPKNSAFPSWWDFSDPVNQPRWEGDGPANSVYPYSYYGCAGLFGGNGKLQVSTTLVFKAKVPAATSKRIFMLNTRNGKITASSSTSILSIVQTNPAGGTEELHFTATPIKPEKENFDLHDAWASANGVILPLKNGYTYKITYRFELINGMVFPCFEL